MKTTIIIPTVSFDRFDLLFREIKSIQSGLYKGDLHIVIIVDGDKKLYEAIGTKVEKMSSEDCVVILNEKRSGWVFSTNRGFKEFESEYYIYASDDLVFPPDCIECAMEAMEKHFPDGNGVVSLGKKTKCIFGLVGNKWVEHFPKREVFCPYYTHYGADAEHTQYAHETGRFAFASKRDSQVKHFRLNDRTRIYSRTSREKDLKLHHDRQKRERLWGTNFDR